MLRPYREESSCGEELLDCRTWIDWIRGSLCVAEACCCGAQGGCDWGRAFTLRAYAGDYAGAKRQARTSFGFRQCAAAAECGVLRNEPRWGCYVPRAGAVGGLSNFAAGRDSEGRGLVRAHARRGDDSDFGRVWDFGSSRRGEDWDLGRATLTNRRGISLSASRSVHRK